MPPPCLPRLLVRPLQSIPAPNHPYHIPSLTLPLPLATHFPDRNHLSTASLLSSIPAPLHASPISLELTTSPTPTSPPTSFSQRDLPFNLFLYLLTLPKPPSPPLPSWCGLYWAQVPLLSPTTGTLLSEIAHQLGDDVPSMIGTRNRLEGVGLWMSPSARGGWLPSSTPLHKDPSDNVFLQLAGRKRIRLFEPGSDVASALRGKAEGGLWERDMAGGGRAWEEGIVWGEGVVRDGERLDEMERGEEERVWEVEIGRGEVVVIPRGWWHAVRSVPDQVMEDEGKEEKDWARVVASVNWWFR